MNHITVTWRENAVGTSATSKWQAGSRKLLLQMHARLRAIPDRRRSVYTGLLLWVLTISLVSSGLVSMWLRPGSGGIPFLGIHRAKATLPAALVTAPAAASISFGALAAPVAPIFQPYYDEHAGAALLGPAVTAAMPVSGGWLQFYRSGALFLPGSTPALNQPALATSDTATLPSARLDSLLKSGQRDPASGVVALATLPVLLAAGSQMGISGSATGPSTLTYVALRQAMAASQRIAAPSWYTPNRPEGAAGVFVPEAKNGKGIVVGHLVPLPLWQWLTQPTSAPNGWLADFASPLTEALATDALLNGAPHHLIIQAFEHQALVMDTTPGAATSIGLVATGIDYLKTFGAPLVPLAASTHAWVTTDAILRQAPNTTSAVQAHVGMRFPLLLAGGSRWVNGTLWYQAAWHAPHTQHTGWIPAAAVGFVTPDSGPARASFDALDPALAAYLAGYGGQVGVVAYDVTRNVYYTYNENGVFITASSVKVAIMVALLTQVESQGRAPNSDELYWLTLMIEHSDNEAAQILYERVGDAGGMQTFLAKIGVNGLSPTPFAWGWSHITPSAMVQLLTMLNAGQILTPADRGLALSLMRNIEPDQQFGLGDTAPDGAVVAMKNGWNTGPDDLWNINTSGIVIVGGETYILSVYTGDDPGGYGEGIDIVEHVCSVVGQDLK